ncbi:MAG: Uma2 family endonuclease [Dehalococcoidia bacterium]|nr:Uma2 family endonuclease [Dehalococcoidia bacterium]
MTTGAAAAIVYPESDGMPLPDGEYQAPIYRRTVGYLEVHFSDVPGARVNGDTFIYYVEGDPRRSVSPDCYVVFGLSAAALESLSLEGNNTYLIWEVGKPPDFVLEIGSPSTRRVDLGSKRDLYAQLGVSEYWQYDPSGGDFYGEPLVGEYLADGEYHRFEMRLESDDRVWSHSDALNLDLWWQNGDLRFWDPVSEGWLLSHEEEKARAEAAESRADTEMSRRLATEYRVAELEAQLRLLRGE